MWIKQVKYLLTHPVQAGLPKYVLAYPTTLPKYSAVHTDNVCILGWYSSGRITMLELITTLPRYLRFTLGERRLRATLLRITGWNFEWKNSQCKYPGTAGTSKRGRRGVLRGTNSPGRYLRLQKVRNT